MGLDQHRQSAEELRSQIEHGLLDRAVFRAALLSVPLGERDGWLDRVFGLGELPADGPELPRDCVPYLPCSVDALLRIVEHAPVRATDVFVDVGSGVGRAAALVHLLTGATVVAARDLAARLLVSRIACVEGDATALTGYIMIGSVFFLYCPFSGNRLAKVLDDLEPIAQTRTIRVCAVDLPLPPRSWLVLEAALEPDVAIYRSTLFDEP